jgi:hypothetical protein
MFEVISNQKTERKKRESKKEKGQTTQLGRPM